MHVGGVVLGELKGFKTRCIGMVMEKLRNEPDEMAVWIHHPHIEAVVLVQAMVQRSSRRYEKRKRKVEKHPRREAYTIPYRSFKNEEILGFTILSYLLVTRHREILSEL